MTRATGRIAVAALVALSLAPGRAGADDGLTALTRPMEGRSMRATSSFRLGPDGKYCPDSPPLGDTTERSNYDNFRVEPGKAHVCMDVKGPGMISHMWFTFLGPEPQGSGAK